MRVGGASAAALLAARRLSFVRFRSLDCPCLPACSLDAPCLFALPPIHQRCRAPAPRTVLLYGPRGSGKSLLAAAVAHQAGATLFDVSPAATAGQYAGKAAATMVHMVGGGGEEGRRGYLAEETEASSAGSLHGMLSATHPAWLWLPPAGLRLPHHLGALPPRLPACLQVFKAARALAPSVVLVEDVDQVGEGAAVPCILVGPGIAGPCLRVV